MMKYYNWCMLSLLGMVLFVSCFDDEGNYNYVDINEVSVNGFGNQDTVYRLLYLADTLRIYPTIEGTLDSICSDEDYEFRWELGTSIGTSKKIVTTTRHLDMPVDVRPGTYILYFRVKDKNSNLIISRYGSMVVSTSYTTGFLVLSDQADGKVQLDMIAMNAARNDTTILHNMLEGSGVPEMKNGVYVCHTGDIWDGSGVKLWVMSETGAYYMNGAEMTGSPSDNFTSIFYTTMNVAPDAQPIIEFPRIASGYGSGNASTSSTRGYMLSDGSIVWGYSYGGVEEYGNPINRVSTDPDHLLDVFPHVFYAIGSLRVLVAYDRENERFILSNSPMNSTMSTMTDKAGEIFPWNQGDNGRTLIHADNTRSTLGGSSFGCSYALMKDKEGHYFIYAFYVDSFLGYGYYSAAKKGYWEIDKEVALEIDQATRFLFSSSRTLLYYVVGDKIHCYDYSKGGERHEIVKEFPDQEITWMDVDYWTEYDFAKILVATYNSTDGGTLRKFSESYDQNSLDWTEEKGSVWGPFPKIKSVSWRNSSY